MSYIIDRRLNGKNNGILVDLTSLFIHREVTL
jgi:hypothetical protein